MHKADKDSYAKTDRRKYNKPPVPKRGVGQRGHNQNIRKTVPIAVAHCTYCTSVIILRGFGADKPKTPPGGWNIDRSDRMEISCKPGEKPRTLPIVDRRVCYTCMRDLHHRKLHGNFPVGSFLRELSLWW